MIAVFWALGGKCAGANFNPIGMVLKFDGWGHDYLFANTGMQRVVPLSGLPSAPAFGLKVS